MTQLINKKYHIDVQFKRGRGEGAAIIYCPSVTDQGKIVHTDLGRV